MNFGARVRLKPSNDQGEFEIDRARSKNNIAENLIAQDMKRTIIHNRIQCHLQLAPLTAC